eukprot:s1097_g10.t5
MAPAATFQWWLDFLWSNEVIQVAYSAQNFLEQLRTGLTSVGSREVLEEPRTLSLPNLCAGGVLHQQTQGWRNVYLPALRRIQLPIRGEVDLRQLPQHVALCWDAPLSLEALEAEELQEDEAEGELLASDRGLSCGILWYPSPLPSPEEGALRSAIILADSRQGDFRLQLRWFCEGNVLCSSELGCSFYLVADCDMALTFELRVGVSSRVLRHDFSGGPQWGAADFCERPCGRRVMLQLRLLEVPSRFHLFAPQGDRAVWRVESWTAKERFGKAAYATWRRGSTVSEACNLPSEASLKLLVGVGPEDCDDLVGPSPAKDCRPLALQPLALFATALPGASLRFALEAGGLRRVYFHRFTLTAAFAGSRCFLPRAGDAVRDDALDVAVEILGAAPLGDEEAQLTTMMVISNSCRMISLLFRHQFRAKVSRRKPAVGSVAANCSAWCATGAMATEDQLLLEGGVSSESVAVDEVEAVPKVTSFRWRPWLRTQILVALGVSSLVLYLWPVEKATAGVSQTIALEEVNSILPEVAVQPYGVLGVQLDSLHHFVRQAPEPWGLTAVLDPAGLRFIHDIGPAGAGGASRAIYSWLRINLDPRLGILPSTTAPGDAWTPSCIGTESGADAAPEVEPSKAEDDDKMEKAETKRQKVKESGKGKAIRRPAASCEAAKPETAACEAAKPETARGRRKRHVSPKAKASPKRKSRKTEKKPEESAPEPAGETMTEKDKRRHRARTAFAKLQDEKIPGLELPKDLGSRISFTVKCPDGVGSSVGVILASDSFYVSKAVEPDKWPTDCTHLKENLDLQRALVSRCRQGVDYETDGCCHDLLGNLGFLYAVRQVLRIKEGGLGYWGLPCNSFSFMARSLHQRTGGKDLRLSAAYPKDYGREVVFISTEKDFDGCEGVPSNENALPSSVETSTDALNAPSGDDGRPSLRNLETQTTIPLGHVDDGELDDAMSAKYNKPLWRCLFESLEGKEIEIDRLVKPTSIWLDIRNDRGDIDVMDPEMAGACCKAVDFKTMLCKKELELKGIEQDHQVARTKIDAAADAMIQQQKKKVEGMGTTDVENSPLFQVNKNNIVVWKGNKYQVLEKAYQCAVDEVRRAQKDLEKHVEYMIESAYAKWANHMQMEPDVGIDPELFGELEAIMQLSLNRRSRTLAAQSVWMNIRKSVDFEMVRVFDSMVFEDEVSDDLNLGITATGDLDQQIAVGGDLGRFQAVGLGGMTPGSTPSTPAPKGEKQKKVVPLSKQVTNKISSSSAKLTELMAWEAKDPPAKKEPKAKAKAKAAAAEE